MTTQNMNTQTKHKKTANASITLRLSRGRTLKITFRPRIRVSPLLIKLLAVASGIFAFGAGLAHAAPPAVNALPTGGQVVSGVSTIGQAGNTLNINQATQKTIINWQSFDIGSQAAVNFYQPNASSIALNRIVGNNASQIYGKLNANGQVFLFNPQGTLFAPGAQVNLGGLLSSTMHMNDADFLAGNYQLSNPGLGIIDNQSIINANSIAFAGNDINNSGSLIATNVSLVAGNTVAVDISGDGLIRARVENPSLQAHITNSGLIDAVHQVTMSAGQAKDTLNNVVNNSGIIKATGLSNEGGVITLQGGTTLNSGSLDASSATGKGGTVAMLGEHVGVTGFGSINASGETGGGTILVGGDYQGKNASVQNASRTYFGADANLKADAITSGDGGKVIVWADEVTRSYGNISARGGAVSGNGGFVEVSGKHNLDFQAQVDTRAQNGKIGTLLLDPDNIIIDFTGGNILTDADSFADPGSIVSISNSLINASTSSVMLQANANINFNAPINMTTTSAGLTARAGQFINLNNSITTNGGIVDLTAGAVGGFGGVSELRVNADISTTGSGSLGANVLLRNNLSNGGPSLLLNANVTAGQGTVYLTDIGNGISQVASSSINANNLLVNSIGNVALLGANNFISSNVAANITGAGSSFTYKGLLINIGLVDLDNGITTNAGDLDIFSNFGAININKNLNAKNVFLDTLDGAINLNLADITASGNVAINSGMAVGSNNANAGRALINGNISQTGASPATLDINADTNIIVAAGSQITSNNASNITLTSGASNNGLPGRIELNGLSGGGNEVRIDSKGGNITLTGGSGFASTDYLNGILLNFAQLDARGSSSVGGNITLNGQTSYTDVSAAGVAMLDSDIRTKGAGLISVSGRATQATFNGTQGTLISATKIESENGNITIEGDASAATTFSVGNNSNGAQIDNGSLILTTGSGNIAITGKSANGGTDQSGIIVRGVGTEADATGTGTVTLTGISNGGGTGSHGVLIDQSGLVESASSQITIDGTSNSSGNNGVVINSGGLVNSISGNINITGLAANTDAEGVAIKNNGGISTGSSTITVKAGNNDPSFLSDQIFIDDDTGGFISGSSGSVLNLTPLNNASPINISGSLVGGFDLDANDIASITGFNAVEIGSLSHTGTFDVLSNGLGSLSSTNQQINLVSNTANINFLGANSFNSGILVNANSGNVNFTDSLTTSAGNVHVIAKNDLTLSSTAAIANTAGNITLIADTGDFINNNSSPSALSVSAGSRWLVYSADLASDDRGALAYDFKQYNASYGNTVLGTGNGFLYGDVPGTLTATITGPITKQYNGDNIATVLPANIFVSGLLDGDSVSFTGGSANYTDPNAGTGKTVNMTSLSGGAATNGSATVYGYTLPIAASTNTAEITTAPLTITANNQSKGYGDTFSFTGSEFDSTSLVNLETIGSVSLSSVATSGTANAINHSITASAATGGTFNAANYNITYVSGTFTVTPKVLNITATNQTKAYGDAFSFTGSEFNSTALANSETIGSVSLTSSATPTNANAATYGITASAATGGTFNAANYNITYGGGNFIVTPKAITVTANNLSKVYGDTLAASSTSFTSSTLANSETIGSVSFLSGGGISTANTGSYSLVASNATGGTFNPTNYTITYNNGNLTVTPKNLIITADNQTKTVGDIFTFLGSEFTHSALANGETIGSTLTITSSGAPDTASVGTYNIVASSATGGTFNPANYNISYVDGSFNVIPLDDGVVAANNTEKNAIDNTTDLALVLVPVKLKVLNDDGSESLVNVDVAKGKVLTCQ